MVVSVLVMNSFGPRSVIAVRTKRPRMRLQTVLGLAPIATVFLLVFGGIYGGFFSPTEGAAVGAFAALLAALAKGTSRLSGALKSDDTRHMSVALRQMGDVDAHLKGGPLPTSARDDTVGARRSAAP